MGRLLLNGHDILILIEFNNTEPFGIIDIIAKDRCPAVFRGVHGFDQLFSKPVSIINIISQDHGARVIADKFSADQEGLGQSVR